MRRKPSKSRIPPSTEVRIPNLVTAAAVGGFLLLAVALVFGRTVGHDFVNFDDDQYVYENPQLTQGLATEGIAWAFTTTRCYNWHPLTWLSYLLDYQFYGLKPWGYHLTNIVLHAATAILLFLVLWRMTGVLWPSAFVAAVFAIHPLRVESVAWVSERKDVLSGLFFMLTLAAYVGYVRRPFSLLRYLTVIVVFALGLMAKPMLVTLPFVLLLLDFWPLGRFTKSWRLLVEKLPLLALSVTSCVVTPLSQGVALQSMERFSLASRTANALASYVAYVGQLFYPAGLLAYYTHPENNLPIWQVAGALLLLAVVTGGAMAAWRRWPWLLVGWFWYLGMLVPVIGLVQVGHQSMADRYTYLPQIGLVIALAWGAKCLLESWPHRFWACGVTGSLVLAVLMGCAWRQTAYWCDSGTLWTRNLDGNANNIVAHNNLGVFLHDHGHDDEAIVHYKKALEIAPDYAEAHNNLGLALAKRGLINEALDHYQAALELRPDYPEAHNNLGLALAERGMADQAIAEYRLALQFKPDHAEAHKNLGLALAERGQFDEGIAHCRRAVALKPDDAETHNNLALALFASGRIDEAIAQWAAVIRLQPDDVSVLNQLAWALATSPEASVRNGPKAVELAQRAARLTGSRDLDVLDTLAAAYAEAGRFAEAVPTAEQALALASSQKNTELADALRARIELYRAATPYRDTGPLAAPRSGHP